MISLTNATVFQQKKHAVKRGAFTTPSLAIAALLMSQTASTIAQSLPSTMPILTPENEQITATTAVPLPEPDSLSGWLQIEVAVLTDTNDATLAGEQWPLFPEPRYPSSGRWLKDPSLLSKIAEQYPNAAIAQSEEGAVTVLLPIPLVLSEMPASGLTRPEGQLPDDGLVNNSDVDTSSVDTELTNIEKADSTDDIANTRPFAIPLELVDAPEIETRAGAIWLDDFETLSAPIENNANTGDLTIQTGEVISAPVAPPPLPEAFRLRPVTLLADGLAALAISTDDQLQATQAWLQPPGASNLPILFDYSGDDLMWPELQGFIELRRGSEVRLGINFWLNTAATYLPEGFVIAPPPRSSKQITVIATASDLDGSLMIDSTSPVTGSKNTGVPDSPLLDQVQRAQESQETESIRFINPFTGLRAAEENPEDIEPVLVATTEPAAWHWRHLIQIADTRPVDENTVRYFDHPVIKVLATYRELTWREVYALGIAEAEAAALAAALRQVDAAIEAAEAAENTPVDPPVAQLPPGNAPIY